MKKLVAFVATAVLAGSVFAFAGCKENEEDKSSTTIPGNYQEATKEEVGEALGTINPGTVIPDLSDANAKLGFEFGSNLTVNVNVPLTTTIGSTTTSGTLTVTAVEDVKYNLVIAEQGTKYTGAGYANGDIAIKTSTAGQNYETGFVAKTELYNDTDYIYAKVNELKEPNQQSESGGMVDSAYAGMKVKFSIEEIMGSIADEMVATAAEDQAAPGESAGENIGFAQYLAMLEQFDVKVALDQSSGLKVKVTVDKNSFTKILAYVKSMAQAEEDEEIAGYIDTFNSIATVNKFNADLYVAFTEAGVFDKAAVDLDIDIKLDGAKLTTVLQQIPQLSQMPMTLGDSTVVIKGGLYVNSYSGDVTVPNGIATDASYVEIPLGGSGEDNKIESV